MSKGKQVWFKWDNGQLQKVYIYRDFAIGNDVWHRAISGKRTFVLKDSDYGKTWNNCGEGREERV